MIARTALGVVAVSLALVPVASAESSLSVSASFGRDAVAFGAPVQTRVVVRLDPARVDPGTLRIGSDLAPLTVLSQSRSVRRGPDGVVVTLDRRVMCLVAHCIGAGRAIVPRLPPVEAGVSGRNGRRVRAAASWPVLHVVGRVSAAEASRARTRFRADTTVPAPTYAASPAILAALLEAGAVLLGLVGAWLAFRPAVPVLRRRAAAEVDELARAVTLVQESLGRPPPDRRRALALLSRVLAGRDRALAGSASDLAWSRPPPDAPELTSLVAEVRERVGS